MRRGPGTLILVGVTTAVLPSACGKQPAHQNGPPASTVSIAPGGSVEAGVSLPRDAALLLAAYAVQNDKAARSTLYTWTTQEQAAELRKTGVLLSRSESPERGASYSDQLIAERAVLGSASTTPEEKETKALATLLDSQAFARARHAWSAPWATVVGWPGETYGDVLVSVALKPDALFVQMRTSTMTFVVVDMSDRRVPNDVALANPERIAAIYFVHDTPNYRERGSFAGPQGRMGYRDYVLCNESMIAEWSIGTPKEREAIDRSREAIDSFLSEIGARPIDPESAGQFNARVVRAWDLAANPSQAAKLYEASLAAPNSNYVPQLSQMRAIANALRSAPDISPPLSHRPTATFARAQTKLRRPPPRKVPPSVMGTF